MILITMTILTTTGTVKSFSTITNSGKGGGPVSLTYFTSFGSSLSVLGDIDLDGVRDLAIGSKGYYHLFAIEYLQLLLFTIIIIIIIIIIVIIICNYYYHYYLQLL